jgi:hypothetical protein
VNPMTLPSLIASSKLPFTIVPEQIDVEILSHEVSST